MFVGNHKKRCENFVNCTIIEKVIPPFLKIDLTLGLPYTLKWHP